MSTIADRSEAARKAWRTRRRRLAAQRAVEARHERAASPAGLPLPVVRGELSPGRLSIAVPFGSWLQSRDVFTLLAEAARDKAAAMPTDQAAEADYLARIADGIDAAVGRADRRRDREVRGLFG